MTCRIDSRRGTASPERSAPAQVAPARPLEPAIEGPKRIDAYIDYFGSDPCGETLLDGDAR
jgi:hypothetical protein